MLGRLIRDTRNIVVIFCKYIAYAIIALTHTCYLIKNYAPDELKKFLPPQTVRGMASETWLQQTFKTWVNFPYQNFLWYLFCPTYLPFSTFPYILKLQFDRSRCSSRNLHNFLGNKGRERGGRMFVNHSFTQF